LQSQQTATAGTVANLQQITSQQASNLTTLNNQVRTQQAQIASIIVDNTAIKTDLLGE
jgi:hypothetical protein